MTSKPVSIGCGTVLGVHATPVLVQATVHGTGSPRILGQADPVVREAYHRIMTAFAARGLPAPRGAPTINFAPASIRKTGSGFDLAMALALAGAAGQFAPERSRCLTALGEVALDGQVLPVRGAVAVAIAAARVGRDELLLAPDDAALAAMVPGVRARAVARLDDAVRWLRGELELPPATPGARDERVPDVPDLADVRGHETPKQALLVAAAGGHNVLFVGPPGSGKTALMRRLPGLLPPPAPEERVEILSIATLQGSARGAPSVAGRPWRAPHHTASTVSLLGGGPELRPGEATLAHRGVLFLDELAEFRREALDGLRQPLEERTVTIARARGVAHMPADFILAAAMNPCPCGYFGHPSRPCLCGPAAQRRYRERVSGPLLDRIDLQVEVPALPPEVLRLPPAQAWSTATLRDAVLVARERQRARAGGRAHANGRLADAALERAVGADPAVLAALDDVIRLHGLSGRARVRLLRIARTLADLADRDAVREDDLLSAARLRGLERSWTP